MQLKKQTTLITLKLKSKMFFEWIPSQSLVVHLLPLSFWRHGILGDLIAGAPQETHYSDMRRGFSMSSDFLPFYSGAATDFEPWPVKLAGRKAARRLDLRHFHGNSTERTTDPPRALLHIKLVTKPVAEVRYPTGFVAQPYAPLTFRELAQSYVLLVGVPPNPFREIYMALPFQILRRCRCRCPLARLGSI